MQELQGLTESLYGNRKFLEVAFRTLDTDQDGKLSYAEFKAALARLSVQCGTTIRFPGSTAATWCRPFQRPLQCLNA